MATYSHSSSLSLSDYSPPPLIIEENAVGPRPIFMSKSRARGYRYVHHPLFPASLHWAYFFFWGRQHARTQITAREQASYVVFVRVIESSFLSRNWGLLVGSVCFVYLSSDVVF